MVHRPLFCFLLLICSKPAANSQSFAGALARRRKSCIIKTISPGPAPLDDCKGESGLMYKNIIFDLGGVVVDFNPREFLLERFYNEEIEHKVFDLTFGSE